MKQKPPSRILVVEDEDPKLQHLLSFISTIDSNFQVVSARSVTSALQKIQEVSPDLLLLDMSLPTFDVGELEAGGRPQGYGGLEVLRQMAMLDLECPTVVVTGYEAFPGESGEPVDLNQLTKNLNDEFPETLKDVLHYNSTNDEWKTKLKSIFSTLI
ncbi:response regulator [Marinobacter oulmenensis]|uniref:CheY-like chemotaxis protein n=1 Tax=Marinobacter oulmenensis TaxID=643747 RepID=A0A840UB91_9GAMM|nr:response regulator [Marinobacter oulmenensis]MBB5320530.1 CheY-like chemotaxis protein [Marinobacter oulmenensis]